MLTFIVIGSIGVLLIGAGLGALLQRRQRRPTIDKGVFS
jgi:hypothetical protein